jgi:hypothetical protein
MIGMKLIEGSTPIKKEPRLYVLGNFQLTQVAKELLLRDYRQEGVLLKERHGSGYTTYC